MSVIHIPKRPDIGLRQVLPIGLLLLSLVALFVRLWYLQVVKAAELSEKAVSYGKDVVPELSPRGLIEDRNGKLLAGVHSEWVVTGIPAIIGKDQAELQQLSNILGTDPGKLEQKLENGRGRKFLPAPIFTGATVQQATQIAELHTELPGVDVAEQPIRYYTDDTDFAHVLGYVWTPNDKDLDRLKKQGIKAEDFVGKTGVEAFYEKDLMGVPGNEEIELDAKRRPLHVAARDNPIAGSKLQLSIDSSLQKLAMGELKEFQAKSPESGGAVVAIDPKTGEVLCLASNPTYSANAFLEGIKNEEYDALSKDKMKPLFDRAVAGAYSPGSTFKIISTLAAAEAGTFNPNRTVFCPGYYKVGDRKFKCLGHHGSISYETALIKSCNTYFADQAIRTGPDALRAEALKVGLGARSGIDLPGESKAIVPTDDWLRAVQHKTKDQKPSWYPGDTVNLGIGQGELSATPLQMADLACLVANSGVCYRPHLIKGVYPPTGEKGKSVAPEPLYQVNVSESVWNYLHEAMIGVIEHGTGRKAEIEGVVWAGKTGSTEHGGGGQTHSWFVGYAPANDPKIAIAVLVERSGHGGEVSAPIAAKVVKAYLDEVAGVPSSPTALSSVRSAWSTHLASFSSPSAR
jgi:penicillin-binding protein 2